MFLVTIIISGCRGNQAKDEVLMSHGTIDAKKINKEVEIKPENFSTFSSILNRANQITCNDSIPIINVENDEITHVFNIKMDCWNDGIIYDYSQKNILIIHNDSIEKRFTNPWVNRKYHLNDLEEILVKDYSNNGTDPNWSVSPSKFILRISVDENKMKLMPEIFNKLGEVLENQSEDMEFRIWLDDYLPHYIPPKPPSPIKN